MLLLQFLFVAVLNSRAQTLSVDRSTVGGGGGTSNGGNFTLAGSIGQPEAGTLSGGAYTLTGGFWPGIALPSPMGAPTLFIQPSAGAVTISWSPAGGGFVLEQSAGLVTPSWSAAPTGNPVTITFGSRTTFFRLRGP